MKPPDQENMPSQDVRINEYYRILDQDPGSKVFAPLAEILAKQGMLDAAKQLCETGLEAHPDFSDGHLAHARVLYLSHKYAEAMSEIEVTLGLDERKVEAHLIAAEIHFLNNQAEEARKTCARALKLDPDNYAARNLLSRCNHRMPSQHLEPTGSTTKQNARPNRTAKTLSSKTTTQRIRNSQPADQAARTTDPVDFSLSNLDNLQAVIDIYSVRERGTEPSYSSKADKVPRKFYTLWIGIFLIMLVASGLWLAFR